MRSQLQLLLTEGLRRRSTRRRGKQAAAIRHTADEFLLSTRADVLLFRSGNHVSRFFFACVSVGGCHLGFIHWFCWALIGFTSFAYDNYRDSASVGVENTCGLNFGIVQ